MEWSRCKGEDPALIEREWGEDAIIRYRCSGQVSIRELLETLQETVADHRYQETTASIWDLRGGEYTFGYQEHQLAAPNFRAALGKPDDVRKTAWVVQYQMSEAIIDMYYRDHEWPQEWRSFNSVEAAEAWCLA